MTQKALFCSFFLSLFLFGPATGQERSSGDEQAVLKVINQDRQAWANRDYAAWEGTWAHKPYTASIWSSPGSYTNTIGWENISATSKRFFKNNPNPVDRHDGLENPIVTINGNIAVVKANVDGNHEVRILEKENGQWRHIQFCGVFTQAYDMANLLNNLEGAWRLDKESVEVTTIPGRLIGATAHIQKQGTKLDMETTITWKNGEGIVSEALENFQVIPSTEGGAQVSRSFAWTSGTGADISHGLFQMEEDSKMSGKLTTVGEDNPWGTITMDFSSPGKIDMTYQMMNDKGEDTWSMSYSLVK